MYTHSDQETTTHTGEAETKIKKWYWDVKDTEILHRTQAVGISKTHNTLVIR